MAFLQQRAERQRFAGRPIDADAAVDRLHAIVEEARDGAVDAETIRHLGDPAADVLQHRCIDTGDAATRVFFLVGDLEAGPFAVEPVGLVRLVAGAGLELGIETRAPVGLGLLDFAFGDYAFGNQPLGIDFQRARMRRDLLVHHRLGEGRLVALVVAVAAIAEHVDHDRLVEFLPELGRDLGGEHHRFRDRRRSHGRSAPRSSSPRRTDRARSANSADRW